MSANNGLLLLLDDPQIDPHNIGQLRGASSVSAERHASFNGLKLPQRPTSSGAREGVEQMLTSKRALSDIIVDENMDMSDEPPLKLSKADPGATSFGHVRPEPAKIVKLNMIPDVPKSPTYVHAFSNPAFRSLACRVPVASGLDNDDEMQDIQTDIQMVDRNSMMPIAPPIGYQGDARYIESRSVVYALPLVMAYDPTMSQDLRGSSGLKFPLAVDTADSVFWFLGRGFRELREADERERYDWPKDFTQNKRTIRMPALEPAGATYIKYKQGGSVHICRWRDDMTFAVPSWDWALNKQDKRTHKLKIPRVLADAASRKAIALPVHGNLGLAVPGNRSPWKDVTAQDRLTFSDILNSADVDIDTPAELTIRLLPPGAERLPGALPPSVNSFLYYGPGTPCGKWISKEEGVLVPQFSPSLKILPAFKKTNLQTAGFLGDSDSDSDSDGEYEYLFDPDPEKKTKDQDHTSGAPGNAEKDHVESPRFQRWSLRLMSMTLLEPLCHNPDYDFVHPTQWRGTSIDVDQSDKPCGSQAAQPSGVRVTFDSCSAFSTFPMHVLKQIWRRWFNEPDAEFPNGKTMFHKREFSLCDIIFVFQDDEGEVYNLRCSAKDFLTSPWLYNNEGQYSLLQAPLAKSESETEYILGMNFFWVAMLKMEGEYHGSHPDAGSWHPTVQLAPQRVLQGGRKVGGPFDLAFLPHLPPRLSEHGYDVNLG